MASQDSPTASPDITLSPQSTPGTGGSPSPGPGGSPSPCPSYFPAPCPAMFPSPRFGTVIPNRIFVGGIDVKTNEGDLRHFFSQHGEVKEVKIVIDRSGISKGYGFITFETPEDAQKILNEADRLSFKDKKLNIGQAIRKPSGATHSSGHVPSPAPLPLAWGAFLTPSTGFPYTFHNGVAYFHSPETHSHALHWPSVPAAPLVLSQSAQSVYQPPACQPYQTVPSHAHWSVQQTAMSSSPVMLMQPECLYQPVDQSGDGGHVHSSVLDTHTQETVPGHTPWTLHQHVLDHMVQPTFHQVLAPPPGGSAPIMPQDHIQEQSFHNMRPHQVYVRRCSRPPPRLTTLRKDYDPSPPPPHPHPQMG